MEKRSEKDDNGKFRERGTAHTMAMTVMNTRRDTATVVLQPQPPPLHHHYYYY